LATGTTLPVSTNHGPDHPATTSELIGFALFPLIHATVGLLCVLYGINHKVFLDDQGISATNLFGRESFRAQWSEMAHIERHYGSKGGVFHVLRTNDGRKATLPNNGAPEIIAEIQARMPHVRIDY
jgi:hypothetical protein